jgi:hypothetical protein
LPAEIWRQLTCYMLATFGRNSSAVRIEW